MAEDSLQSVLDSVFGSGRYQWSVRHDPFDLLREWWRALGWWLESLAYRHPDAYSALIWSAVAVLSAIVLHAAWVLLRVMRGAAEPPSVTETHGAPPAPDADWYRGEALRLARAGRFAEAIRADFRRLLLELDARAVVRFDPSKTPLEYVREPGLTGSARGWLAGLVGRLYACAYAGQPCGPAEYARWQREVEQHAGPR